MSERFFKLAGAIFLIALFALAHAGKPKLEFQASGLSVRLHDTRDRAQLATVFATWRQAKTKLLAIGLQAPPVTLEAFASATEFAQATNEPWFVAASTSGQSIRTQRLAALEKRGLLEQTILHEAFHSAQPKNLPRWLAEGLARIFSGEANHDPRTSSGLERLSGPDLELALQGRSGQAPLNRAYLEATRRAQAKLRQLGWLKLLKSER